MQRIYLKLLLVFSILVSPTLTAFAQATATINGNVTDATGAIIRDATVVLSDPATGARYEVKTDSAGSYFFANVAPGPGYVIEFNAEGFEAAKVQGVYADVANAHTQNAKLKPGAVTTEVQVTDSAAATLNTTDATVGNNFETSMLQELPVQNRSSPSVLFTLQPGITASGATTGARTDQTNTTIDGLDVNDFSTGSFAAITGNAPIDSIQEFRGTTAGFTADSGPGGGGQFQLVTRGGTNQWHGNINEYHRDNSTTANDWFNNNASVPQPELVWNQFGGAIGGPIMHDKLFFFFNFLDSRIAQQQAVERAVPLQSFAAGNVSYINDGPGCSGAARQNTDPGCISALTPAQVQQIDPANVGESKTVFGLFKNRYPAPNDAAYGDGINSAGFRFNSPYPDNLTNYTGRVDYTLNATIKLFGVGNFSRENEVDGTEQFPGDPPSSQFVDRSHRYAVGMDWQLSNTKINQLSYGSVVQDYDFARPQNPEGVYQISFTNGFTPTLVDSPYASPTNAQSRLTNISQVNDTFSWTLGRHQVALGGYFKWIHCSGSTTLGYNSYGLGLGGHVFGVPGLEPADLLPNDSTASEAYDNAFTSALGRVANISSTFNYDVAGNPLPQPSSSLQKYVYYQTQPYISDTWRVTPHLTLTAGVTYQFFSVPYEQQGLETVQTTGFDEYFKARLSQSAVGASGNSAVPFITYVLGGKKNNGPAFYHNNVLDFAPRLAFSYNPGFDSKTVFNGSTGLVYDRTVINAVQYQQVQYSYLFQQNNTVNNGNNADPTGSVATDPRLDAPPPAVAPATPKAPFTPWVSAGQPYGLIDGTFNAMIDPNLKTPYSIMLNFGMQHEFAGSTVLRINYVGRLGRRLLAQADASQLVDFPDPASGQTMNQAMVNIEREVRSGADPTNLPAEPWYENQLAPGYNTQVTLPNGNVAPNNTTAAAYSNLSLVQKGDFGDSSRRFRRISSRTSAWPLNSVRTPSTPTKGFPPITVCLSPCRKT